MTFVIRAIAFANGDRCPHANQLLRTFDHDAYDGRGFGTFTRSVERAMKFATAAEAMAFWNKQSFVRPLRPDGEPNKPLSALTVEILPLPNRKQDDANRDDVPA